MRVETVQKSTEDIKKKEEKKAEEEVNRPIQTGAFDLGMPMGMGQPQMAAIMPAPGMMAPPPMNAGLGMGTGMGGGMGGMSMGSNLSGMSQPNPMGQPPMQQPNNFGGNPF